MPPGRLTRVRFMQVGEMQLKPDQWRPFEAEQEMALDRVEFSWRARFPFAPLVTLRVHDWYRAAEGGLEVRLLGLPLKRLRGDVVAKDEARRYLTELPWAAAAMAHNREREWREWTRGRSRWLRASPARARPTKSSTSPSPRMSSSRTPTSPPVARRIKRPTETRMARSGAARGAKEER